MRGQRWFVSVRWFMLPKTTRIPKCSYLRTFLGLPHTLPATPLMVPQAAVKRAFGYRLVYMTHLGRHQPIASRRRVLALRENAFFPPPSQPALTCPK